MENQKANGFIITVACGHEELYRLNTSDFVEEISIGRDTDCTWSVGHADTSVSNRHAILSRRKKEFYLTDLGSRNGMFCNGSRLKEVKLTPGMNILFGACTLSVSSPGERKSRQVKPHLLKYVNEKGKTVKFSLHPGTIKIGGAEKYDLALNSALVSSPHASITGKSDGSYWIKDLNSRNGTSVNHAELVAKTERMLKHGDVISIADVDMTYYDPSVKRNDFRLTFALLTLFITAVACIALYYTWQQMKPSADMLIRNARIAARQADFIKARDLLASAASAKNADASANNRKLLLTRIDTWEHSARTWNALQTALAKNQLKAIPQLLGSMDLRSVAAWDWNEENAVGEKQEIEFIKNAFSAMSILESSLNNPETTDTQLAAYISQMKKVREQFPNFTDSYMESLKKACDKQLSLAEKTQNEVSTLAQILREWEKSSSFDLTAETARLEALQKNALPVLAAKLENVLPLLYSIKKAKQLLAHRESLIVAMRFAESSKMKIELPKNPLSIQVIDNEFEKLRKLDGKYRTVSQNMDIYYGILERNGFADRKEYSLLVEFLDQKKIAAVFACDSLKLAYPPKKREKASGVYDEMVGIEYLYASLMMIKTYESGTFRYDIPFLPKLHEVSGMLAVLSYFVKYAESEIGTLAVQGDLKKYIDYLKTQLKIRDQVIASLQEKLKKPQTREYFIAHGIIFALNNSLYMYDRRAQVYKEFTQYRTMLQKQNSEYNTALPEDAIKIRENILNTGIPGDPVVKRMWSLR